MTKKTTMVAEATTKIVLQKEESCKYGCTHGGLVAMLQMQQYDTKHYLKQGKYLNGKNCVDCTQSIVAVFEQSKEKAVFYLR